MGNENELKEYCDETEDIKVKDEPIEYDVNIDDKKIISDTVESGNVKLEEFDDKIHVQKHETLEAGDCIISCKVEVEENYVYACDFNQGYNTNQDELLVTQNIEGLTANGDILYNCPRCTYTSNSRLNYKRHLHRHNDTKRFLCTVCERRFYEKRRLQQHMLIHSGQKVFECSLCDYGAIRREHINKHIRNKHAETADKRYKCPKCEYRTNDKYDLKKHDFVHEDARPHECQICNRQFKRSCELKAHGFVHNEEKRYQCAHCDYKTNIKTRLVVHLKNKHLGLRSKEYECPKCTFKTIYPYDLKRHSRKHLENFEKKFKCPRCPYQTDGKRDLRRHNDLHDNPKSYKYLGIPLST